MIKWGTRGLTVTCPGKTAAWTRCSEQGGVDGHFLIPAHRAPLGTLELVPKTRKGELRGCRKQMSCWGPEDWRNSPVAGYLLSSHPAEEGDAGLALTSP